MPSENKFHKNFLSSIPLIIGSFTAIYGVLVIIAWQNDINFLKTLGLGEIPIKANAGACFIFSGLSLILLQFTHAVTRILSRLFSLCVIVIGLLSIAEIAFSVNLGIDEVLFRRLYLAGSVTGPTRMAFNSAICQILIAAALFHLSLKNIRFTYLVEFYLIFASSISFLGLIGFFNGLVQLSEATGYLNMATIAAIFFILISSGILLTFYSKIPLKTEIDQRIFAGTIFTATMVIFISIISVNGYKSIRKTTEMSDHEQRIKNHLNLLLSDVLDVETGVRGYLISNDEEYIQSMAKAKEDLSVSIQELSGLLKNNKVQLLRIDTLNQLIRDRVAQAELLKAIIGSEGKDAGIDFFRTKKGKILTDRIRILILKMKDDENQNLKFRNENEAQKSLNAQTIIYLNLVLELFLIVLIFIVIRKNISQRNKLIMAGRVLSEELEAKVNERTLTLIKSEEKYRYMFTNNPQPMWIYDLETLFFLEVNRAATHHYGFSREEFLSMTLKDIGPAEDVDALLNEVNQQQTTYNPAAEWRHVKKSGEIINVEIVSHTITFNNRKARHVMVTDITERQKTREALQKAKANLDAALASMTDAVFISNNSGEFVEFNDAFATFHRFRSKAECAKKLSDYPDIFEVFFANGEPAPLDMWAVPRALRGEIATNEEYIIRRKDTGESWVGSYSFSPIRDKDGIIVGSVVVGRDITDKKRTEEMLRESEVKFRKIYEEGPFGIALVNSDFKFISANPTFCGIIGYSERELQNLTFNDITYVDDINNNTQKIRQLIERKISVYKTDKRYIRKDGQVIWGSLTVTANYNQDDKFLYNLAIIEDITGRKQAEDEINKLTIDLEKRVMERTSQLEAANKELESFSYSVSHDLMAPLRHINGFSDILTEEYSDQLPDEARRYLQTIADSAKKMGVLIADLLNFSRTGRVGLKMRPVDMRKIVEEVISICRPSITDRKIEWKIGPLTSVNGDLNLLQAVWVNLIGNALKYTRCRENTIIRIDHEETHNEIVFSIKDNGVGFDMKYAGKLFGVFQRLHSSNEFEGTGIGLANVRRIVSRHGGRTWAEAEPDKGATFYFSIPK